MHECLYMASIHDFMFIVGMRFVLSTHPHKYGAESIIIPRPRDNSCTKCVCRNAWFPHGCLDVSCRSWNKSKNPCPWKITHFPTQCIIRTWKALSLQPHASEALMTHLVGKCVISTWALVLAIVQLIGVNKWLLWGWCCWNMSRWCRR